MVAEELERGGDVTGLLAGMSPTKAGGYMQSTVKSRNGTRKSMRSTGQRFSIHETPLRQND